MLFLLVTQKNFDLKMKSVKVTPRQEIKKYWQGFTTN